MWQALICIPSIVGGYSCANHSSAGLKWWAARTIWSNFFFYRVWALSPQWRTDMPAETSATWSVTLCSWVGRPRLFSCLRCLCLATGVTYQLTNFQNKNSKLVLRELFCKKEKKRNEERKKQILHILCFLPFVWCRPAVSQHPNWYKSCRRAED